MDELKKLIDKTATGMCGILTTGCSFLLFVLFLYA